MKDKKRLGRVAALGCLIHEGADATIHHVKRWRRRPGDDTGCARDDRYVLSLCPYCHQDGPIGDAVERGVESWEAKHGTQAYWLDVVAAMLGEDT